MDALLVLDAAHVLGLETIQEGVELLADLAQLVLDLVVVGLQRKGTVDRQPADVVLVVGNVLLVGSVVVAVLLAQVVEEEQVRPHVVILLDVGAKTAALAVKLICRQRANEATRFHVLKAVADNTLINKEMKKKSVGTYVLDLELFVTELREGVDNDTKDNVEGDGRDDDKVGDVEEGANTDVRPCRVSVAAERITNATTRTEARVERRDKALEKVVAQLDRVLARVHLITVVRKEDERVLVHDDHHEHSNHE